MDGKEIERDIKKAAAAGTVVAGAGTRIASIGIAASLELGGYLTKSHWLTKFAAKATLGAGDEAGKKMMEAGQRWWKEASEE